MLFTAAKNTKRRVRHLDQDWIVVNIPPAQIVIFNNKGLFGRESLDSVGAADGMMLSGGVQVGQASEPIR